MFHAINNIREIHGAIFMRVHGFIFMHHNAMCGNHMHLKEALTCLPKFDVINNMRIITNSQLLCKRIKNEHFICTSMNFIMIFSHSNPIS